MHAQQDWGLEGSRRVLFDYNSVGFKKKKKVKITFWLTMQRITKDLAGLIYHIKSKDRYVQYMLQVPIDNGFLKEHSIYF